MVTQQRCLSQKYIYTYIYQSKNQYGGRLITHSYTVQQPPTGSDFKQNQSALLKLSAGCKYNKVVIVNPKITSKTRKYIYTYHVRADL